MTPFQKDVLKAALLAVLAGASEKDTYRDLKALVDAAPEEARS